MPSFGPFLLIRASSAAGLAEIDPTEDWSVDSVPLPQLGTAHVRSGAVEFEKDLAPHEAWIRIMSDAFLPCLHELGRSRPGGANLTSADALRYMIALVAIGLVRPPQERDLWHEDSDLAGIVGCAYVRDLLSRAEWLRFKTAFSGNRSALTAAFNTTASPGNFVIPNRYNQSLRKAAISAAIAHYLLTSPRSCAHPHTTGTSPSAKEGDRATCL